MAIHGKNMDTVGGGIPQSLAEIGVGHVVGVEIGYICHLNDKKNIGTISFGCQLSQTTQMLGTTLGGRVGEGTNTVMFQCHAFDFQKTGYPVLRKREIKPGFPMNGFGPEILDLPQPTGREPFFCGGIGRLRIHVDEFFAFLDGDKIVFCFSGRIIAFRTPDLSTYGKKLPASAGVFNMDDLYLSIDFHMGDKSIGPSQKCSRNHLLILHTHHNLSSDRVADF